MPAQGLVTLQVAGRVGAEKAKRVPPGGAQGLLC